jgi:Ser/Thr protein kinase RdoA (MazF antagonist)
VYRVESGGRSFVLKVTRASEPLAGWLRKLHIQEVAAQAGLAPAVVHADEQHRAFVSAFVVDRSFTALYGNPQTREAALGKLGAMLRRVHALQLPPLGDATSPRDLLARLWSGLDGAFALPEFVSETVAHVLAQEPPAERTLVLSHNDVNLTNLIYDGEQLLLLDWDAAGPNNATYDLAAAAVFLRMDKSTCRSLFSAYEGTPISGLPAALAYHRRLAAALCGAAFLHLARQSGHGGASGGETLAATLPLAEFYQRLSSGALSIASAEGQWEFGLALVKESLTF